MTNERLFLDTAFIQALVNTDDGLHLKAVKLYPRMREAKEVWVTEAVLAEVGDALSSTKFRAKVADFIDKSYTTQNIIVVSIDNDLFREGFEIYKSYNDKEWGITDCISFQVMWTFGLQIALTHDKHFEQAGFRALLREPV